MKKWLILLIVIVIGGSAILLGHFWTKSDAMETNLITFDKEGVELLDTYKNLYEKPKRTLFKKNVKTGAHNARSCLSYYYFIALNQPQNDEELKTAQSEHLNSLSLDQKEKEALQSFDFVIDCLFYFDAFNNYRKLEFNKEGLKNLNHFETLYGNEFDSYFIREQGQNQEQQQAIDENNLNMCMEYYFSLNHHELIPSNLKDPLSQDQIKSQKNAFVKDCISYFKAKDHS